MMGIQQKQGELWAKAVDLSSRIPGDQVLKRLDTVLNLEFVRDEVAGTYGKKGNVSIDPTVLMRLMLLLFIDNIRGEREMRRGQALFYLKPHLDMKILSFRSTVFISNFRGKAFTPPPPEIRAFRWGGDGSDEKALPAEVESEPSHDVRLKQFPFTGRSPEGGCALEPDAPRTTEVSVCPECVTAEKRWMKRHPQRS